MQMELKNSERVTRAELARIHGCNKSYITKLVHKGRLKFDDDEDKRINLKEALMALKNGKDPARELEKFRQGSGGVPAGTESSEVIPTGEDSGYHAARTRREQSNATMAEINLKKEIGELVEADHVRRHVQTVFSELKDKLLAMPTRVSGHLVSMTIEREISIRLDEEMTRILGEFAQTLSKGIDGRAH